MNHPLFAPKWKGKANGRDLNGFSHNAQEHKKMSSITTSMGLFLRNAKQDRGSRPGGAVSNAFKIGPAARWRNPVPRGRCPEGEGRAPDPAAKCFGGVHEPLAHGLGLLQGHGERPRLPAAVIPALVPGARPHLDGQRSLLGSPKPQRGERRPVQA